MVSLGHLLSGKHWLVVWRFEPLVLVESNWQTSPRTTKPRVFGEADTILTGSTAWVRYVFLPVFLSTSEPVLSHCSRAMLL